MKLLSTILLCSIISLSAQTKAIAEPSINTLEKSGLFKKYKQSGIAIRGYDTVAYFTQAKAVKGVEAHSTKWRDATWRFATAAHQQLFEQDPERYAPQFGGYCAFGVSEGYLAKIEGHQWSIVGGKLYLNFSRKFHARWLKDPERIIAMAQQRFDTLLAE